MARRTSKNLRIKRKYLLWLADAKGCSTATVDRAAASIDRYEKFNNGGDFGALHAEKARAFKRHLDAARNAATGRPLAASTIDGTLRDLKAFFSWLADQPGYRSKILHSDSAYFSPSRRLAKSARGGTWKPHPSPEQVHHVLRNMPSATVIQRRDRAILAMLFLTGARDGALITLRLRNVDLASACVHFEGPDIETKFGKVSTTWFFPVGGNVERNLVEWTEELRRDLLFGPDDPLFPKQTVGIGVNGGFEAQGLDRAPWASAAAVREICKRAFTGAGLPVFTPHLIRKTLVDMTREHCLDPEMFKAWSQNLSHEDVMTTFRNYGTVAPGRQGELMARMRTKARETEAAARER